MSYTYLCENSICSPGQEAASLAECSSDTPQFALWKLNLTADASCSKDSATESCQNSPYGMTSLHSTATLGADGLTSCVEGFPAKTFPPPEKAQESMEHAADCGGTWPEWFAKFDPVTSSWKTPQCSLLAGLDVFSGTWPRWGMMRGGVCWAVETPAGCMNAIESGFLHLPTIGKNETKGSSRKRFKNSLFFRGAKMSEGLRTCFTDPIYTHPRFAELTMGWPMNWTKLQPLETAKFQAWLLSHGAPSQDSNLWPSSS